MDVSHPEEHLSKFAQDVRAAEIDALESDEDGPEPAVVKETPETILLSRSNLERMQRAIDELPVHYRETLLLCEVEEMSYQEIAEILSIPMGTVMSRLARARKVVRESLRSTPGAPLSRDLSHPIEPHEEVLERSARPNSEVCFD